MPVGLLQCNCTILGDELSREAIVVDPGAEVARILAIAAEHKLTVKQILDHPRAHRPHRRRARVETRDRGAHPLQPA